MTHINKWSNCLSRYIQRNTYAYLAVVLLCYNSHMFYKQYIVLHSLNMTNTCRNTFSSLVRPSIKREDITQQKIIAHFCMKNIQQILL